MILNTVLALPARAESTMMLDETDLECLARNVYYEARNQPLEGQLAVAHVTLNRVEESRTDASVCDIVYKSGNFSWAAGGRPKKAKPPKDTTSWLVATWVARMAVANREADPMRGSTFFHSATVNPHWAGKMVRVGRIGDHIFYAKRNTSPEPLSAN